MIHPADTRAAWPLRPHPPPWMRAVWEGELACKGVRPITVECHSSPLVPPGVAMDFPPSAYPAWPYSQILAFEAGVAVATEPTPHKDLVPGTSAIGPMLPEVSPIRLHWPLAE